MTEVRALGGLYRIRLKGPGGADMAAVVTRSAADELRLQPEGRVSVRVKATALHAFPAG